MAPPPVATKEPAKAAAVLPLTLATLHKIMPKAPAKFLAPLNTAMAKYQINTPKRVAAFLAQLAVESQQLRHTHELWTGKKNFKLAGVKREAHTATSQKDYFEHWYGNRKGLGNDTAEDGYTYRGRGAIQITGKANYKAIGDAIGQPLVDQPDLVETDLTVDMTASAYFFAKLKKLLPVADRVDPADAKSVTQVNRKLTLGVNGGHNGQSERLAFFKTGLATLGK